MYRTSFVTTIVVLVALSLPISFAIAQAAPTTQAEGAISAREDLQPGPCCARGITPQSANGGATLPLSEGERWALNAAIQDEYKARATYAKVIDTFGEVRPFSNIIHAETRHVEALAQLFHRYGIPVPEDTWYEKAPAFNSVRDACAAAVQAEIANAALYDTINAKVGRQDIAGVFAALKSASLERHLPAFQRCLEGNSGQRGSGYGRGGGGYGHGGGHGKGAGYRGGRSR